MKYIVVQHKLGTITQEIPVIFPNHLIHADVAKAIETLLKKRHKFKRVKTVSAGDYGAVQCVCSGKSTTLKLKSRGVQDSDLIAAYEYTGGFV